MTSVVLAAVLTAVTTAVKTVASAKNIAHYVIYIDDGGIDLCFGFINQ